MAMYRTCPECGAHLDPGEQCDCQENDAEEISEKSEEMYVLN